MMPLYLGLDIGGTKLLVASANGEGKILQRVQQPPPPVSRRALTCCTALMGAIAVAMHGID
jgi:predicted NBD/HSP70 family sugar kinase